MSDSTTIVIYWLLVIVMVVGIIGAVVPGIPGASLILGAIIIWGLIKGFASVGIALVVTCAVLLLSIGVDFLATFYGAKRAGASHWGQIGAIIGLIAGFFGLLPALPFGGPLLGIFIGPFLGAFIAELLYCRNLQQAGRAAVGVVVSSLIGNLIQGALAIAAVITFVWTTYPAIFG